MKIYVPGFPVQHIDEPAPEAVDAPAPVAEAKGNPATADTQVLKFNNLTLQHGPEGAPPLKENLRTDGPTLEGWLKAGYSADAYPPAGYAAVPPVKDPIEQ